MGTKDPGTEALYSLGRRSVPAAVYQGQVMGESGLLADFIDDLLPGPSLKPADPLMRFNMQLMREENGAIVGTFYGLLKTQDDQLEQKKTLTDKLYKQLAAMDANCAKFKGPYLCGEQFTMADIDMFGFIERIIHVLPHYRKDVALPDDLTHLRAWFTAVSARKSIKVVTASRSDVSQRTQAYEATERAPYLVEMYEVYALNDLDTARSVQAKDGAPGHNAYHRHVVAKGGN